MSQSLLHQRLVRARRHALDGARAAARRDHDRWPRHDRRRERSIPGALRGRRQRPSRRRSLARRARLAGRLDYFSAAAKASEMSLGASFETCLVSSGTSLLTWSAEMPFLPRNEVTSDKLLSGRGKPCLVASPIISV